MDWDDARTFLAIARNGTPPGAARRLRVNHATISRRLGRLEADLGGRALFERTPTGYVLTATANKRLRAPKLWRGLQNRFLRETEDADEMKGRVRVSALQSLVQFVLAPSLSKLAQPGITIELVGEDRNARIGRREADIAIRHGQPECDEALVRRLSDIPHMLFGTSDYLRDTPEAMRQLIGFTEEQERLSPLARRVAEIGGSNVMIRCSTQAAQATAASAGVGLAFLPAYVACRFPLLQLLPTSQDLWRQPTWIVLRSDVRRVARVRTVADWIVELFTGPGADVTCRVD